mmetsp:Transcript_15690/g.27275  ORF Transcript_15690/g.27275 Transcript_15690/m.27275 type:complete len:390 (-) Transcript_15690:151-1320(-)
MPPQATGFRYTPPSYLMKTRGDTTNRPWNKTNEEEEDVAMRQEDRPARRETTLDAHFQYRVQKKQSRYRNILKGEEDIEEQTATTENSSSVDSEVQAISDLQEQHETQQAAALQTHAREARKQRLSGTPAATAATPNKSPSDAETARSLRAARLRTSLLQRTPEEIDVQTKLEQRRRQQQEADRLAKLQEAEDQEKEKQMVQEERFKLQQERHALEQAKREAAVQLAKQWAEEQEKATARKHSKSRTNDDDDDDSLEEMLNPRSKSLSPRHKKSPSKSRSRGSRQRRSSSRRRRRHHQDAESSSPLPLLEDGDFGFLEEWSLFLRDTTCIGQCFGHDPDKPKVVMIPSSEDSTSTGNPSLPDNNPLKNTPYDTDLATDELQQVYAKYRE